jgi:hypothetical protein
MPAKVGYGNPPTETRFKPGKSGNPSGRPKSRPTLGDDFDAELREQLAIEEGGRTRTLTKQRALVKTLVDLALKGNIRAISTVIASARSFDLDRDDGSEEIDPMDIAVLEAFVARERQRASAVEAKPTEARKGGVVAEKKQTPN